MTKHLYDVIIIDPKLHVQTMGNLPAPLEFATSYGAMWAEQWPEDIVMLVEYRTLEAGEKPSETILGYRANLVCVDEVASVHPLLG